MGCGWSLPWSGGGTRGDQNSPGQVVEEHDDNRSSLGPDDECDDASAAAKDKQLVKHTEKTQDSEVDDMAEPIDHHPRPTPTVLHVHVGEAVIEITPETAIEFFWTDKHGIDTPCMVCGREFNPDLGPSVRTISVDPAHYNAHDGDMSHLVLYNRHMECIQERSLPYIAISHVWHEPIRHAHEFKVNTSEAGESVFKVPLQILEAATKMFGAPSEIWHDYWSVPQWRFEVQQQILLLIPIIYHAPPKIIVHLEDLDPSIIQLLLDMSPVLDADPKSPARMDERYKAIVDFYSCKYMSRVWVLLEFARSRRACLMDSQFRVWRVDGAVRGSYARLVDEARRNYLGVYDAFPDRQAYLEGLRYISRGQDDQGVPLRSLGDTIHDLSTRECKYYRDRFIACHAALEVNVFAKNALEIPRDTAGACRWVYARALQRGDHSPLLLQPCADRETPTLGSSWLVGHELMNWHTWDIGRPTSMPPAGSIVVDRDHDQWRVRTELEYAGEITEITYVPLGAPGAENNMAAFVQVMDLHMRVASQWDSVPDFVDNVARVYPVHLFFSRWAAEGRPGYDRIPSSLADYVELDPAFPEKLVELLRAYREAADVDSTTTLTTAETSPRAAVAHKISDLMMLDVQYGPMGNDRRIRDAMRHAAHRLKKETTQEPLCAVACRHCAKRSVFRLDLRIEAKVGATVYRIKELAFGATVDDGVGVMVQDGKVVGRMRYGIPACKCGVKDMVVIT